MKLIKEYDVSLPTPSTKPGPFKQNSGVPTATAPQPGIPLPGSQKSSVGKITLAHSLEGVEQSLPLKPGRWPAFVEYVEEVSASTGSQGIQFNLRFLNFPGIPGISAENPNHDRKGKHTVYVTPRAMWKVKNSFCAVGQCEAIDAFDAEAAQNVLVIVEVTEDEYTPPPTDQNPDPKPRKSAKCDTIFGWPDEMGGPGVKYQQQ